MDDIQDLINQVIANKEGKEREQAILALIDSSITSLGSDLLIKFVAGIVALEDQPLQKELSDWGKRRLSVVTYQAKEVIRLLLRRELLGDRP